MKMSCFMYGFGSFLIVSGIVCGFTWPFISEYVRKEKLELKPESETFKLWVKTPIPMYLDIYLFNWTNADEFMKNKSVKPEFEEVGPFVFREVHERVNITWNDNYTVTYNQTRTWYFVPEESVDLSVPITNLNVIATTVVRMASNFKNILKLLVDFLTWVYKEELLITRPAGEWLFDGMNDGLLDFIKKWTTIPLAYNKFGWFYGRNTSSSYDGSFNMKTGINDIFNLGLLDEWNNVKKTNFFDGECGIVNGSSGELFPPLTDFQSNLSIFLSDFCGSLTLKYSGLTELEGLNGYHYVGDESVFDNGTENPSAKCFCRGECSPSGVRNLTSCRQAPLFLSFPHFYLADSTYTNSIVGMKPNKSAHEFYMKIHPLTGIPLEVRAQLQLNILLQPIKMFPMFKNVPKVYVPMLWFRQRARVTPDLASHGLALEIFLKVGFMLAYILGGIGLLMIIVQLCRFSITQFYYKRRAPELLITPESSEEEGHDNSDDDNKR